MAEGFAKSFFSDKYNFYSAGVVKHGLNPRAVLVMKESGIDISSAKSNTTDEFATIKMDVVFTVCSDANENCPYHSGEKIINVGFDDPPRLTKDLEDEEEILAVYRRVRDEIKLFILKIEELLNE